jgi:tellurite resistance protein TehA-like permease
MTMTDTSHSIAAPSTSGLAGLSPAYFGMVMATGIVSIAAHLLGHPLLARALFALNLVADTVLCLLNLLRALRHRQRIMGDLFDHLRGPGFFTSVAATSVVGSQFLLLTDDSRVAGALWAVAVVLWVP